MQFLCVSQLGHFMSNMRAPFHRSALLNKQVSTSPDLETCAVVCTCLFSGRVVAEVFVLREQSVTSPNRRSLSWSATCAWCSSEEEMAIVVLN